MDKELSVLVEDFKLTSEKIEQFLRNQHNYLNTAFILTGGYLFFSLSSEDRNDWVCLLPVLIAVILGIVLYHYQRVAGLQGYKQYLEDAINGHFHPTGKLISYTNLGVTYMMGKNFFSAFNFIMYGIIYVGSCIFSFYIVSEEWKFPALITHLILLVILGIGAKNIRGYRIKILNEAKKKASTDN